MEKATKAPCFRMNWLVACIALAAFDLAVLELVDYLGYRLIALGHTDRLIRMIWLWVLGASNALRLGIVLVIGLRPRGSQRFAWGFVLFGAIALGLYVGAVGLYFDWTMRHVNLLLRRIVVALWNGQPGLSRVQALILKSIVTGILLQPQLAFALVGGLLFRMVGEPTWRETIRRLRRPRFTMFQGLVAMGAISIWLWLIRMQRVWISCGSLVVLLWLLAGSRRSRLTQEMRAAAAPVTVWMRVGIAGYWVALILALCWIVCALVSDTLAPSKPWLR